MSPTKPTFKPKFAAPVASSTPTSESKRQHETNGDNEDPVDSSPKKIKKSGNRKKLKDETKKETSLTDSQYDRIFESVTARVLAGDFLDLDDRFAGNEEYAQSAFEKEYQTEKNGQKKKKRRNKSSDISKEITPATNYREAVSKKSPNAVKRVNEVTPTLSPLDIGDEKLLVQQPQQKKKEKKKVTKPGTRRKSLDYAENRESEINGKQTEKKGRNDDYSDSKGIWVQCSACEKWRYLDHCHDPASLPEEWNCSLNNKGEFSSCAAPEEAWEDSSQENYVYTEFAPGSIVWAKMAGYPSWPAMVDREPDYNSYCETFPDGNASYYHVVFLDDRVSRAWISRRNIEAFRVNETPIKLPRERKRGEFGKDLESAKMRAHDALTMTISERLEKFSFLSRFQGKSHWHRDKNAMERKAKKKPKEASCQAKSKSGAPKTKGKVGALGENEDDTKKSSEKKLEEGVTHVSVSDEEEQGESGEPDDSTLFSNMVIDETHDESDEIPFVQTGGEEVTSGMTFDSDIFTVEAGKSVEME